MKTLIVTSQVTYIPENYSAPLRELIASARPHLAGVVFLDNLSWSLCKSLGALWASGCTGLARHLSQNILELPLKKRENLFNQAGIPVLHAATMNDPEMISWVKRNQIDLIINLRTRCIYRSEILSAPRLGCINVHHGILPKFRGTFCDLYAMADGRRSGFTIHQMNEKIDAGQILLAKEVSQEGAKDYVAYLAQTSKVEGVELSRLIHEIANRDSVCDEATSIRNSCEKPVYTKNPNWGKIREFKRGGIQL